MAPAPRLLPNLGELYRATVAALQDALEEADAEAIPRAGDLLRGDLAALLSFAADGSKKPGALCGAAGLFGDLRPPGSLVAGAGFEPAAFRL